MKTNNKKKVVVSVLALAMGAGLAGSISGSVAWYQYSTRTTAQLQGVSAGTTRNLQVRIADGSYDAQTGDWKQDLSVEDINTFLGIDSSDANKPDKLTLNPVTAQTTGNAKNAALATRTIGEEQSQQTVPAFFGHPVYQYNELPQINSPTAGSGANLTYNYVQIPLQFRVQDNEIDIAKAIYLVDANFLDMRAENDENHADITPALRAHFSSSTANALLANKAESTAVSGALDLNKNGAIDRHGFTGEDEVEEKIVNYGAADQSKTDVNEISATNQLSYAALGSNDDQKQGANELMANDNNAYTFVPGQSLGNTVAQVNEGTQTYLNVTLTIWLEGWTELPNPNSTEQNQLPDSNLWDLKYRGSDFGLQLRFACEAEA